MAYKLLKLDIVTQEKRLLTAEVRQVTVETVTGEITVLPNHIPLLTRLSEGLLHLVDRDGRAEVVAIFGGFLEVDAEGGVSVLADAAVRAGDIDLAKVQQAKKEAEETLRDKKRETEFALAEASLRRAYLEIKAAQKGNKPRHAQG